MSMELCPTRHSRAWEPRYNHIGIKTVSSRLLQRMARMEADRHGLKLKKNEKVWLFRVSMLYHTNHRKKKLLVLPAEICFLSSSHLYRSILCVDTGTK